METVHGLYLLLAESKVNSSLHWWVWNSFRECPFWHFCYKKTWKELTVKQVIYYLLIYYVRQQIIWMKSEKKGILWYFNKTCNGIRYISFKNLWNQNKSFRAISTEKRKVFCQNIIMKNTLPVSCREASGLFLWNRVLLHWPWYLLGCFCHVSHCLLPNAVMQQFSLSQKHNHCCTWISSGSYNSLSEQLELLVWHGTATGLYSQKWVL